MLLDEEKALSGRDALETKSTSRMQYTVNIRGTHIRWIFVE